MSDSEIAVKPTAAHAPSSSKIANSGALYVHHPHPHRARKTDSNSHSHSSSGLFSFASTTLILSLYNVGTRGIATPNVVVGMAVFCGGLAQLLAGMWEFPRGNMFGATGKFPHRLGIHFSRSGEVALT